MYTIFGKTADQGMAYSLDGRTFTKYSGNPVLPQLTPNNRDPDIIWHEPSNKWIMVMYGAIPIPAGKVVDPKFIDFQTHGEERMHFLSSPDLKTWTHMNDISFSWECPNFFPLPLDGNAASEKWVLSSASGCYKVGAFDGTTFTPETPLLDLGNDPRTEHTLGADVYAGQTFNNIPAKDGRRIRIAWMKTNTPSMPFNQSMTIPMELKLITTDQGPRLTYTPIDELKKLRSHAEHYAIPLLKPDEPNRWQGSTRH